MQSKSPRPPLLAPKLKPAMWGSDSLGEVVGEGLPASLPLSAPSFPSLSGQGHTVHPLHRRRRSLG